MKSVPKRPARASKTATRLTAGAAADAEASIVEYSIDELARAARMTVRNVRAYQDRGLLPPPTRRGRAGIYDAAHLARLRIIGQLLERGYSLANIDELIVAWERGHDLEQLLGLESAITTPWSREVPTYLTVPELLALFEGKATTSELEQAVELGVLEPDGGRYRVPSPRLLHAGAELVRAGIPLPEMLAIVAGLRANVERVADDLVDLVVRFVFDPVAKDRLPPASEVPRLAEIVWRLRPVAEMAINAEAARALERAVKQRLGERLAVIVDHLRDAKA
jgi:DNA-binding transcriptional MerR regulator